MFLRKFAALAAILLPVPLPAAAVGTQGVNILFFNGSSSGIELSPPTAPCLQLTNSAIDFDWGDGSPGGTCDSENFGAYVDAAIVGPTTGTVNFCSENDDEFRLQIENSLVINSWYEQGPGSCQALGTGNGTGTFAMTQGRVYPIRVWFHEDGGGAVMRLFWRYGGVSENQIVPVESLRPSSRQFITLSQGGWSNTAADSPLTSSWFNSSFASGLKIGGNTNSITISSANGVRQFLPQSGAPSVLSSGPTFNLTRAQLKNTLAGQVAALTLNVALNPGLSGCGLATGYAGSVADLLVDANLALNGPSSKAVLANLTMLAEYVNLSFPAGVDQARIVCN